MEHAQLEAIAQRHGDSFYLFDPDRFVANLEEISSAFRANYGSTVVAFALKANYMPALVRRLRDTEHLCEVVSTLEYDIANLYLPDDRLIYNGPCKSKESIRRAIAEGAMVNLDSFFELESVATIADEFDSIRVGLRVNFDIGTNPSRFGFDFENGEFARAVDALRAVGNVSLTSLHSHYTTSQRSLEVFERRITGMLEAYDSLEDNSEIEYLNVGGGFFGPMSDEFKRNRGIEPPDFEAYSRTIAGAMSRRFGKRGPRLVIEPGVSMVADSMDYVVRVVDCRKTRSREILTVDGSINNLYPTGSRYQPDYLEVTGREGTARPCDVAGNTCMEHDVLMSDCLLSAQPGDFLVFRNRGAYSNVYTAPFIQPAPSIVGLNGEIFASRQTYKDVLSHYSK